ncbi:MAG: ABC transporter substrate-binding protein [Thermodesulfobacteriota bacterium]
MFRCCRAVFAIICCFLLGGAVGAGAAADPRTSMQATVDAIMGVLQDPQLAGQQHLTEKKNKVIALVQERFDFREMSQRTLGAEWRRLNGGEQDEFVGRFTSLLQNTYINKVETYSDEKVTFREHEIRGDKAVVATSVLRKGVETPVVYRMFRKGDDWYVYDVVIEGVSLLSNYRTQFSSILRKESFSSLLARIDEKIVEQEKKPKDADP